MKMMGGGTDYNDYNDFPDAEQEEEEDEESAHQKKSNLVPVWGNEKTMNLNTLVLTNIQSSQYFKVKLYALKTYHEVLDEIYYQVSHLEPWEKGSRKTAGQTGMCGGVRGVGAGGIVSTAYCILYKLFTLRLTRKQLNGCLNNADSPYIRGLGLMYIRYTQPPADLWTWLEPYLDDEEELDVRAGGGQSITIGAMCRHLMTKLDWHSTLFPRIPVPIQKDIEKKIQARDGQATDAAIKERLQQAPVRGWKEQGGGGGAAGGGGGGRSHGQSPIASSNGRALSRDRHDSKDRRDPVSKDRSRHTSRDRDPPPSRDRLSRDREPRPRDLDRDRRSKDLDRDGRSKDMDRDGRSRDMDRDRRSRDTDRDRRSRDRLDRRSRDRDGHSKVRGRGSRDRERSPRNRDRHRDRSRDRAVRKDHHRRDRERRDLETSSRRRSRDKDSRDKHKRDRRDREKDSRRHHRSRSGSFQDFSADLQREKERIKSRPRSRSRSRDRDRKYR